MARQRTGSAKKNLYYHNALILHKSKKQTVENQAGDPALRWLLSGTGPEGRCFVRLHPAPLFERPP
jgi:hypothetical protein